MLVEFFESFLYVPLSFVELLGIVLLQCNF